MSTIPFNPDNFHEEAKECVSGINLSLDYANLKSGFDIACEAFKELIGETTYNAIIADYDKGASDEIRTKAVDALKRAMLHQVLHEQLIFLIVRIDNDGITTKKNSDETTIYKYQQDALANTLINNCWFWTGKLLEHLIANPEVYADFILSDQFKDIQSLPVGLTDFKQWVGIGNIYFVQNCRWIIREVWMDAVEARFGSTIPDTMLTQVKRAVVYTVMDLACQRLPYAQLPENVRKDIDNEQSKTNKDKAESHIRTTVARQFAEKAERYWNAISNTLAKHKSSVISEATITNDDKFILL